MVLNRWIVPRAAAAALAMLALDLLGPVLDSSSINARLLAATVVALALVGAVAMWRRHGYDARCVAALVATAASVGAVLDLTLGMPGSAPTPLSPRHVIALLCSGSVACLLVLDARAGRPER